MAFRARMSAKMATHARMSANPESGQGLVAYVLILVLVAFVIIAILTILGQENLEKSKEAVCKLATAMGGTPCATPTPVP